MATQFTSSANPSLSSGGVSNLSDLYEKTNTDVKIAVKLNVEEYGWFRKFPRENIKVSPNENRVPLVLNKPNMPAAIPEGGNERVMGTVVPTHGTFLPTQLNVRYGYTGLAMALDSKSRGSAIENQTQYQAMMGVYSLARGVGLQTYGQSNGVVAIVKTTGSGSATQVVPLKNAFGSSSFVAGGDAGIQDTYLSNIFEASDHIALVRGGALVEFGNVTASPSATSGIGYIDVTFQSSITPTVGDSIVFAEADGDNLITGTDFNNWTYGLTEALTAASLLGVTTASYSKWQAGSQVSTPQRLSFAVKERMSDDCLNASGYRPNRFIMGQGVRRDAITGQLGGRRYDSAQTDLQGDLEAGAGEQFYTSMYALPNTLIGWYDQAYSQIMLSDLPDAGSGSKAMWKMDKVQGKSQVASSLDLFWQKIPTSRGSMGYASNLQSA